MFDVKIKVALTFQYLDLEKGLRVSFKQFKITKY